MILFHIEFTVYMIFFLINEPQLLEKFINNEQKKVTNKSSTFYELILPVGGLVLQ